MRQDLEDADRRGQMVDELDSIEGGLDDGRVLRLALEEADPTLGNVGLDVLKAAGRKVVHDDHLVAPGNVGIDEMRADETCSAGD